MDKYYYFMAQMPYLQFAQEPKVTHRYFLEEARKWLTGNDYQYVIQANINEYSVRKDIPSQVLLNYVRFEYDLRRELSLWRAAKKEGHEHKSIMFPASLIKEGNPLEVERNLLHFRWKYIEELEIDHHFDLDAIIAYFLKLQILERLFCFDKEKGKEKFRELSSISKEDNTSEVL